MQAYEFLTKPTNGVITIPEELRRKITSNIKVIILDLNPNNPGIDDINATVRKSDMILPPTLDTRDWKFDREDANER